MFGMASLDVMIGIINLIFALACTAIVEVFSAWCEVRSKNLEVALTEFLHGSIADGSQFADAFFAHPVAQTLSVGDRHPQQLRHFLRCERCDLQGHAAQPWLV